MVTLQVSLDENAWRQLQQLAERRRCSPDELAREVLAQWLQLDKQDWQARMERLIRAFRHHTQGVDPAEIEAEITATYEEYRLERLQVYGVQIVSVQQFLEILGSI